MLTALRIIHFDVSQGESTLISFIPQIGNAFHALIDGGRKCRGRYVVRCLKKLGIKKIDYAICTHLDNDHHEGLVPVIKSKSISVANLLVPKIDLGRDDFHSLKTVCEQRNTKYAIAKPGFKPFESSPCEIRIVHVGSPYGKDDNYASIGCLVTMNSFVYYTAGDLPTAYEDRLKLPSHVCAFKCGHHGANTSTSEDFLKAIMPTAAFISAGRHRHGHPHQDLINRLVKTESLQRFYTTNCLFKRQGFEFSKGIACSIREKGVLGHVVLYTDTVSSKKHGDGKPEFFVLRPAPTGKCWWYTSHFCGYKAVPSIFKFLRLKESELPEFKLSEISKSLQKLTGDDVFDFEKFYGSEENEKLNLKQETGKYSPIRQYLDDDLNFSVKDEEKKSKEVIKYEYEHAGKEKRAHCPGCGNTEEDDDGGLVACAHGYKWFVCEDCQDDYKDGFACE